MANYGSTREYRNDPSLTPYMDGRSGKGLKWIRRIHEYRDDPSYPPYMDVK